jgi:hypothetical protein
MSNINLPNDVRELTLAELTAVAGGVRLEDELVAGFRQDFNELQREEIIMTTYFTGSPLTNVVGGGSSHYGVG